MTAKESLHELVERLSEEEARGWLREMEPSRAVSRGQQPPAASARMNWDGFMATIDQAMDGDPASERDSSEELQAALAETGRTRFREIGDW